MHIPPKLTGAQSSSAGEYRSVIDDLTVEIQKLKEELKRYKQKGPDMLRKDKLFEIKIHGLPKRKRRELEATLRDFTASLDGSPNTSSSPRNKVSSRHQNRDRMHSAASGSVSKHAPSSSGSHTRPVDSAYHSMSTGAHSSGTSLYHPSTSRVKSSEQKVENYLRDIPEGLYPRHVLMTDKEKKKVIVRRLEQLFTGKIKNNQLLRSQTNTSGDQRGNMSGTQSSTSVLAPVVSESQDQQRAMIHQPPTLGGMGNKEASREAVILPPEQQSSGKKSRSRDNGSASNSLEDQTESGGNGQSSGGTNTSPTMQPLPEQRPTRLKDLDPDRVQIPSDNMDYIKHLGLVPPELISVPTEDVHPDAEGWVYLNLLCNLAQLHMINVTPAFVRSAVSQISTKFQLSPDGRKIRWRGGQNGTKFSSDSSADNSGGSMDIDDTGATKHSGKRQKTDHSNEFQSGSSSKRGSKFGHQASAHSDSFHYKPMFVHRDSSNEQISMDETLSSYGPAEDSNVGDSRWGQSGSSSNRRKRRHGGAIIYYSGAPFCTDLSGDHGDFSPTTYMTSSGHNQEGYPTQFMRPLPQRSDSGSYLPFRPLSDKVPNPEKIFGMDINTPGLTTDLGDDITSEVDLDLQWSEEQQFLEVHTLEPCGLGGVLPEDHFMVVVTTKRPKEGIVLPGQRSKTEQTTETIISRLASMSTSSPGPHSISRDTSPPAVKIDYVSGRIKRLQPVRLPPPAIFFPPFSSDSDSSGSEEFSELGDKLSSEELSSDRANIHRSDDYPDGVDLTSGDEDGEDPENEPDTQGMYEESVLNRRKSSTEAVERSGGSSAATAGGLISENESSGDMSS